MSMKVLIVEDTKTIATLLRIYLMALGVPLEVFVAPDGKEGLRLAREHRPVLILSDVKMPEMTGFELVSAIRREPGLEQTPFILITSLSDKESEQKGKECGASAFLIKPITPQGLRDAIGAFLTLPPAK